ncbi:MAG: putative lipoprotein [Rhizobium sp.]|nr:putative lipoprotein [Rhizobium sp.]
MKFMRLCILAALAASLSGCVLNEQTFNANRSTLRQRPDVQARGLSSCESKIKYAHIEFKRRAATFIRADLQDLPQTLCRRMLNGYLSGRMQYSDFKALTTGQKFTPGMIQVLRTK